jgi:hypothetical protein
MVKMRFVFKLLNISNNYCHIPNHPPLKNQFSRGKVKQNGNFEYEPQKWMERAQCGQS